MASPVYSLLPDHTQPAIKPSPPPHTHTNGPQDYFSIVAFFIFLRETLEAAVIIAVLLQCMNRTMPRLKRQGGRGGGGGVLGGSASGWVGCTRRHAAG